MEQLLLIWPAPRERKPELKVVPEPEPRTPIPVSPTRFPILRPQDRERYTVVWPPPSPYGALSAPHVGEDTFADQLFALGPFPATDEAFLDRPRPRTRADCAQGPRPCPWVSCRHNLYLDVREDGNLKMNFPDREPDEMSASCALDLAEDGPRTLDSIAALMGMSKERARQLEAAAFDKLYERLPRLNAEIEDEAWI